MSLTIFTYPEGTRAAKGLICAEYAHIKINVPEFTFGVDNKSESFLKMNPNGKVPTLQTPEGCLFESNSIARYVARLRADSGLYGNSFFESAQVDQWCDWCLTELEPPICNWLYPIEGFMQYNQKEETIAKQKLVGTIKILNDHLLNHTYVVGERVTLADVVLVCTLVSPFKMVFDANYRKNCPNVTRWFQTCVNQPEFITILGKVELCAKAQEYVKPKKEKVEKAAPKAEKAPKDDAEEEAPKPKAKNPFEELPPSPMVLDDWLRTYSNYHDEPMIKVMDLFYPVFDNEGWSLWIGDYMYDEDNTVLYMTANFVDGYIQRCEPLRKYAFGIMNIYGDEDKKPFHVKTAWLLRGHEIAPMLDSNPDAEYFTWTRVTLDNEANKKRLGELWCSQNTYLGEPVQLFSQFK